MKEMEIEFMKEGGKKKKNSSRKEGKASSRNIIDLIVGWGGNLVLENSRE